jgi:DNA-binding transcriptional LysR family regulator
MLDARQLRHFLAVAQDLHFGRAADRLHVAQSALSAQVAKLEQDLGVRLLHRAKRSAVRLTDAGLRFQGEAAAALRQLERADRIGRQLGRGEVGDLDIAYVASAALCGLLPDTLRAFRRLYPEVNLRLLQMETPRQLSGVEDGSIDIGFVRPRPTYPVGVQARIMHKEPLLLAMATDHPLASSPTLSPSDVMSFAFIVPQFDEAGGFSDNLAALSRLAGAAIKSLIRVNDFMTALSLASAGYGLVLIPASSANLGLGQLAYRKIDGFGDAVGLAVTWRGNDLSPTAVAFLATMRTVEPGTGVSSVQ